MKWVNTTLGPIDPGQLGKVNVHDHVVLDRTNNVRIPEDFEHTDIDLIVSDVLAWRNAGGGVIVDSSPIGAGRNVHLLYQVSQASKVPIIISTGFHKLSYYSQNHWLFSTPEHTICEILTNECTLGVLIDEDQPLSSDRYHMKANMLKVGVDSSGFSPVICKIINAACAVSKALELPLMIHTEPGVPFEKVIRCLDNSKIPPGKVLFCHLGKSLDHVLLKILSEKGYLLEFDEMVRSTPPLEVLARTISDLINQGYVGSVCFGGDLARRSYWTCYGGKPGLAYLVSQLSQQLLELGFTEDMLMKIWIENPQELFI